MNSPLPSRFLSSVRRIDLGAISVSHCQLAMIFFLVAHKSWLVGCHLEKGVFYSLELCVDFLFPVTATRKAKDVIKSVKKCIGSRSKTTQLFAVMVSCFHRSSPPGS